MADDIVTRLRRILDPEMSPTEREVIAAAGDEIELLRAAGDALAEALNDVRRRHPCDCADRYDHRTAAAAMNEWKEARRG